MSFADCLISFAGSHMESRDSAFACRDILLLAFPISPNRCSTWSYLAGVGYVRCIGLTSKQELNNSHDKHGNSAKNREPAEHDTNPYEWSEAILLDGLGGCGNMLWGNLWILLVNLFGRVSNTLLPLGSLFAAAVAQLKKADCNNGNQSAANSCWRQCRVVMRLRQSS